MTEYHPEPNSHRYKEQKARERKKLDKVITGKATVRKKTGLDRVTDRFNEDITHIFDFALRDVLIPSLKKALYDIVTNGADMIIYPNGGGKSKKHCNAEYVYYDRFSSKQRSDRSRDSRSRTRYLPGDVKVDTRGEAEEIISRMEELLDVYEIVTVADLYDLAGLRCEYTDNNYGWTNIRNAEVIRVHDGYIIKMPKALPID